jgi:hypothetical protein
MKKNESEDSSPGMVLFSLIKQIDSEIDEWILHFINQVENENGNQSNHNE